MSVVFCKTTVNAIFKLHQSLIECIAAEEIFFQNLVGPLAKLNTTDCIYSISNRYYHIKIEKFYVSGYPAISLLPNYSELPNSCFFCQFSRVKNMF